MNMNRMMDTFFISLLLAILVSMDWSCQSAASPVSPTTETELGNLTAIEAEDNSTDG